MTPQKTPGPRPSTYLAGSLLIGCLLLAVNAAAEPNEAYRELLVVHNMEPHPTPGNFLVCHSHGCEQQSRVHLSAAQWQQVRRLFSPTPVDAARERQAIAQAVALLERMAGEQAGTAHDKGGNLKGFGSGDLQQDCIDESANSTLYLTLLEDQQLLRWHTVEPRATRGFVIFGWPHSTAVIKDKVNGKLWTVDSWFHDNGVPPEVIPLALWRSGWHPKDFSNF